MTNWTRALGIVLAVGVLSTSAFSQLGRGGGKGGGSTPPPKNQGSGGGGGGKQPPINNPKPNNQGGGGKSGGAAPPPRNQGGGGSGLGRGGSSGGGKGGGSTPPPRNQGGGSSGGSGGGKSGGGGGIQGGGGPSNSGGGGLGRGGGSQGGGVRGGSGTQNGGSGTIRGGGSSGGNQGGIGRGGTGVIPRNNGGATGRGGGPSSNGNGGFVNTGRAGDIGRVQLPSLNKGSIAQQAGRMNEARPNRGSWGNNGNNGNGYGYGNYNGWRCGYYQYDNRWNDNSFWYSHYTNNPWDNRCTISPWYYYSNLPAYIVVTRIVFVDNSRVDWGYGQRYNGDWNNTRNSGWGNNNGGWGSGNGGWNDRDRDRDGIRDVVYDLRDFFERQDRRALSDLIDRDRVNIYHEGRYSYSVDGEDFYDMMLDGALATRTLSYEIEDVRHSRDGIQISARHTFATPFNGRSSVMHNYRLVEGRGGWYITDFNTGYRSAW